MSWNTWKRDRFERLGKSLTPETEKKRVLGLEVPLLTVELFHCPSRRSPVARTYKRYDPWANASDIGLTRTGTLRGDYAISAGDVFSGRDVNGRQIQCGVDLGPANYQQAANYSWEQSLSTCNGISFQRSEITFAHVEDGTSQTYLLGEKYLDPAMYDTGEDYGDDACYYTGVDHDTERWSDDFPAQDQLGQRSPEIWGSAHSGAFHMVMVDASVQSISYSIDLDVHRNLGNRRDGLATDWTE